MTKIWDFPGGVHPPENNHQSTSRPIRGAGIADVLTLPLQQHIGQPAKVIVAAGDHVLKGSCLAAASGTAAVPVHAPTSGTIEAISLQPVPHPSGMADWCVTLRPDGLDTWGERSPLTDYKTMPRDQVLEAIRQAGVVGMGGAGFPTHIKLGPAKSCKVHTLILNGAECEPYITADDMIMRERADQVISGLQIMAWILRPERCVIAIEDNKPEAIQAIQSATEGSQTEVVVIPTRYPSGGEKQLIQILTGMEVPHDSIPADIGVICQNVGTAVAVSRAVLLGEPLISRVTTVTGDAVSNPGNFDVLLGTPIQYLLDTAGIIPDRLNRLILGGPMMGHTLNNTSTPVIKTSNCIIAATAQELPAPEPEQPCIRCGRCAEVCPMELLPQQLFWYAKAAEFEKAKHQNLFDCIECGACSYVCPSSIPLVQYYRYAKGEIRTQQAELIKSDQARERFEARQTRLKREQAEREARRKERARAAAEAQARKQAKNKGPAETTGSDERSARAALVKEALARKQAAQATPPKPVAPAEAPEVDVATLEKQLTQAQSKLATMQAMLAEAKTSGADNVAKLERAVAKNVDRVARAESALTQARAATDTAASK